MRRLQQLKRAAGAITLVMSQIDRSFALADKTLPDLTDVRLPNPLDLRVFDKACFLHQGQGTHTRRVRHETRLSKGKPVAGQFDAWQLGTPVVSLKHRSEGAGPCHPHSK